MRTNKRVKVAILTVALGTSALFGYNILNGEALEANAKIPPLVMAQPGGGTPHVSYQWGVSEQVRSNLPKEATLYRFVQKNLMEQDFQTLANKFGITGVPKRDNGNSIFWNQNEAKFLRLNFESGKWSFGDESKLFKSNAADNIPSDAEVTRIATDYLNSNGWLPADFKLQAVTAITEEGDPAKTTPKIIGKQAYFYRYIGDKPVYGVSRIIVNIGNNGEITGVSSFYKDIEPAGMKPLKSVDQAFTELKEDKATLTTDDPRIQNAVITNVDIRYFEDPGKISEQPYLQPIYVFKAEANINGQIEKFEAMVPALQGVTLAPVPDVSIPSFGPKLTK